MTNVVFGRTPYGGFGEPRRAYKPVFEQLFDGEHPVSAHDTDEEYSWYTSREDLIKQEENQSRLTSRIHLISLVAGMLALIVSMI